MAHVHPPRQRFSRITKIINLCCLGKRYKICVSTKLSNGVEVGWLAERVDAWSKYAVQVFVLIYVIFHSNIKFVLQLVLATVRGFLMQRNKISRFFFAKATHHTPTLHGEVTDNGPHAMLPRLINAACVFKRLLHRIYTHKPSCGTSSMYAANFGTKVTFLVKFKHR